MTENEFRTELMKEPLLPDSNGMITLTDALDLGVEFKDEVIEKYRID